MNRRNKIAIAAVAAVGGAAIYDAVLGDKPVEQEMVAVPRLHAPQSTNRQWVPEDHILEPKHARQKVKIDAQGQPCTVWLKLPAGQKYFIARSSGRAGLTNIAHHELDDATWTAFKIYRPGDFRLIVREGGGQHLGTFNVVVTNIGRG